MTEERNNNGFWTGIVTGSVISILTAIITIWIQHSFTLKEKTTQLYLDEKKDFVIACDEYLKQYRQWHELMNFITYQDTSNSFKTSEFKSFDEAIDVYRRWKKDIDFAHGKIFMLSNNEFGYKTLEVSTVLHGSLAGVLENNYDQRTKENLLAKVDGYFFENWLCIAQKEIFLFNSGNRKQKSLNEFFEERQKTRQEKLINDSVDSQLYENLLKVYEYQSKQDSIKGRKTKLRMPTRGEFKDFVNPEYEKKNSR